MGRRAQSKFAIGRSLYGCFEMVGIIRLCASRRAPPLTVRVDATRDSKIERRGRVMEALPFTDTCDLEV
jgi:hypothetical protein